MSEGDSFKKGQKCLLLKKKKVLVLSLHKLDTQSVNSIDVLEIKGDGNVQWRVAPEGQYEKMKGSP